MKAKYFKGAAFVALSIAPALFTSAPALAQT
jgi:hypothetical protein